MDGKKKRAKRIVTGKKKGKRKLEEENGRDREKKKARGERGGR